MVERKFTVSGTELNQSVIMMMKATDKDNSSVHCLVKSGILKMEAFNGIHGTVVQLPVDQGFKSAEEIKFAVNGKMLSDISKNLMSQDVQITHEQGKLNLKAPRMKYNMPITAPRTGANVPPMPPRMGTVDAVEFTQAVAQTASVASDDPAAPSIEAVHFDVEPQNGFLRMYSTDRYRIISRKVNYQVDPNLTTLENFSFDVHARNLKELIKGMRDESEFGLFIDYANMVREKNDSEYSARGTFGIGTSNVQSTIPLMGVKAINFKQFRNLQYGNHITFKRKELLSTLSSVSRVLPSGVKNIYLMLDKGEFFIRAFQDEQANPRTVEAAVEITCDPVSHDCYDENTDPKEVIIHATYAYAYGVINTGTSEYVRLGFNDTSKPIGSEEMKDEHTVDSDYVSIFMPLKTKL